MLLHGPAIYRAYVQPMTGFFDKLPQWREVLIVTGFAVVLSFFVTGSLYLVLFGMDDRFWQAMALAILVPWAVGIPLSWYMSKQRILLFAASKKLEKAESELRALNKKLTHKAQYDAMTGLPNRETFFDRMEEVRACNDQSILLMIDVDHFKNINDSYGHLIGDQALILMSKALRRILRKDDLVGRIGGEEFGILLPDTSESEGQIIGEMIRHEIEATPFEPHEGIRHVITISIGLTSAAPHHERANLLRNSDTALFAAKRRGRNQVVMYEPGMRSKPRPFYDAAQDAKQEVAAVNIR